MTQKRKLLDRVRDAVRLKKYSYRTEKAYVNWAKRYILFHQKRHPEEMGRDEIEAFLTHLAVEGNVAASTQNDQASVYSNHGGCVDMYAPGLYVQSTWHTSATANNSISHSPVAAALAAGAMAAVRTCESVR